MMATGIPAIPIVKRQISEMNRVRYLYLLSLKENFLNFKAIKGNSAVNNKAKSKVKPIRNGPLLIKFPAHSNSSAIKGSVEINSPLAGVGTPIKRSLCRVSILNLAKRMADWVAIKKAKYGR